MLESGKSNPFKSKKALGLLAGLSILSVLAVFFWFILSSAINKDDADPSSAPAGSRTTKTTSYDGVRQNLSDPAAVEAYCNDLIAFASSDTDGSNIRDICILNSITQEYIPQLTDDELLDLATNQPTCLTSGYDEFGYNCFTGFDRNGCNSEGINENGEQCEVSTPRIVKPNPLLAMPENICDIVSGCKEEQKFDIDGFNEFGCNRQGRMEDGTECPYEMVTRIYGEDNRDQLGFDRFGFNEFGCDAQGVREDGSFCPIEEITPLFNRRGVDQWGFGTDGYNEKGCNRDGQNRDGEICDITDITRVLDPTSGLDQFGFGEDGFNSSGCNIKGLNRNGELCDPEDITRIYGSDGLDQFGFRRNGRNEFNCDVDGLKPNGDLCSADELTRIYTDSTGLDQFGYYPDGRNIYGCDENGFKADGTLCSEDERTRTIDPVTGRDSLGIDAAGFNESGCNLQGVDENGELCDMSDVTKVYNPTGLDQFGFGRDGFNEAGCDVDGLDRNGQLCNLDDITRVYDSKGIDQFGFDDEGYNVYGCDINGLNKDGELCDPAHISRILDKSGADQFGLDESGFSVATGCNLKGFRADGTRCSYEETPKVYNASGYNHLGLNESGLNVFGCDANGRKADGTICPPEEQPSFYGPDGFNQFHTDSSGYDRAGLNPMGYNVHNCDVNGLTPEGEVCEIADIPRVWNPETGRDQFGLDRGGFNRHGCNLDGLDRDGNQCESHKIPRIFSADGVSQLGENLSELSDEDWRASSAWVDPATLDRVLDASGSPLKVDGEEVWVDALGRLRTTDGRLLLDDDGRPMVLSEDGSVLDGNGRAISNRRLSSGENRGLFSEGERNGTSAPLVDSDGNAVAYNGNAVWVDDEGFLTDAKGNYLFDEHGERIVLNDAGTIESESGNVVSGLEGSGYEKDTTYHGESPGYALTDDEGNHILFDGEPAYVGEDGFLRDSSGRVLLDENGSRVRLNNSGQVVDENGAVIPSERFTDVNGQVVTGPLSKSRDKVRSDQAQAKLLADRLTEQQRQSAMTAGSAQDGAVRVLDANGQSLKVDGEDVWVDSSGNLRRSNGDLLLDDSGRPMTLSEDGRVLDGGGRAISDRRLSSGQNRGLKQSRLPSAYAPLLDANGEEVMINGAPTWVGNDGFLVDSEGNYILDDNGERLSLNRDGTITNESGNQVRGLSGSGFKKGNSYRSDPVTRVLDANGRALKVDGEDVWVDKKGNLRKSDGTLMLDDNGRPMTLSEDGRVLDGSGRDISSSRLSSGQNRGLKASSLPSSHAPLLNANGEEVVFNGEPVWVGDDGFLVDAEGNYILDDNGERLSLNSDGTITNETGSQVRGLNGSGFKKGSSYQGDPVTQVLDTNGRPLKVDGEDVWVDKNGNLRRSDGTLMLDDSGLPMTLSEDGRVLDGSGRAISERRLSSGQNRGLKTSSLPSTYTPLLDSSGKEVVFDGEPVWVGDDGFLVDAEGNYILDDNGERLSLNSDGTITNETGEQVRGLNGTGFKKGNSYEGDPVTRILDANNRPLKIDGEDVWMDGSGNLRKRDGTLMLDDEGRPMTLSEDGRVLDGSGSAISGRRLSSGQNRGIKVSELPSSYAPLLDASGGEVSFDGEPVWVGDDGFLVDAEGNHILDGNGEKLSLNRDGTITNESGNQVRGLNGSGFKKEISPKRSALPVRAFDSSGRPLKVDGEDVWVDSNGKLRKSDGTLMLDDEGRPMTLSQDGRVLDGSGRAISGGRLSSGQNRGIEIGSSVEAPSFGLDEDGYNEAGCSLLGLNRNGEICAEDDIPRVYGPNGYDQLGFGQDGFNIFGCDINGLGRDGEACEDEHVTRIWDKNSRDQFGHDPANYSSYGLNDDLMNALGCDVHGNGPGCSDSTTPLFVDDVGVNQFQRNHKGQDRLSLRNGFNEHGCDIKGFDAEGNLCDLDKVTKVYNSAGVDQFGLDPQGFNTSGCDLNGRDRNGELCLIGDIPRVFDKNGVDQIGLDPQGYNSHGCDLSGFRRDGSMCLPEEITRIYSSDGTDQFGLDADGYNANDCNMAGLNRNGERCATQNVPRIFSSDSGLDQFGLDADGFNEKGCNHDGLDRDGRVCAFDDIPKMYDEDTGRDQFGFDADGFNELGCDFYGYNAQGELCDADNLTHVVGEDGVDQYGINEKTGYNENGCDIYNRDRQGRPCAPGFQVKFKDKSGKDKFGLVDGVNENGCDINGLDVNGERCDVSLVTEVYQELPNGKSVNQLGFDENGRNIHGCDINGLDPQGNPCAPDEITPFFNLSGVDQFGRGKDGYNDAGCNMMGFRKDGSRCEPEVTPSVYGNDGYSYIGFDRNSYNREGKDPDGFYKDGCNDLNRNRDGEPCATYRDDLNLSSDDGAYLAGRRDLINRWLTETRAEPKPIGEGTYDVSGSNDPIFRQPPAPTSYTQRITENTGQSVEGDNQVVAGSAGENNGVEDSAPVQIPAGYMTQVVIRTPVNSDYTQEVYADITMGELDGAMLIGRPVVPYIDDPVMPRDKFYYEFDRLVYNRQTIRINAVSINVNNDSGMVNADDVNYHRIQRYTGLIVASAVQALDASFLDSQAQRDAERQAEVIDRISNEALVYGQNTRELTKQNLRTATSHVSSLAQQQFNRRPTISKGRHLSLITFREQVQDPRIPMVYIGVE